MPKQVQHRRGSTAQHATFTGALGEITVDTDKKAAIVHDGATAGGFPLRREVSQYIRAMDSIGVDTTFTIPDNAEHYSFHVNSGTTEATLMGTYNITGIPAGFGKELTVFMTMVKGPTTGAFRTKLRLQIGGVTITTRDVGVDNTSANTFFTAYLFRQHPVSGIWRGVELAA
jgi:hypothetical protein